MSRNLVKFITALLFVTANYGQDMPFTVGETLEYSLHFNVIKMGTGSLSVREMDIINGQPSYHVEFKAATSKFADHIYSVRDEMNIWLDKENLYTLKIDKTINEGNYHREFSTTIDYENSIAITNNDTIPIDRSVRDPYSLFFYLRTIPLKVGEVLNLTTFDSKKIIDLQLITESREIITTREGTFRCLVIKPFREGNTLFKNEGDMKIWFSDDERRLPVQIKIKLKYGSMLLKLIKVKA